MANTQPPSSADPRFERILADYLHAVEAGQSPDRGALLAQHPDLAGELGEFFRNHDAVERIAKPIREEPALPETLDGFRSAEEETDIVVAPMVRYFGDYELLGEIARGGMGVVFKARQVSLNRVVALKMILRGELATPADVLRFRAEAEAAGRLDHPGVVPIYEVGEHQGQHYFSMKLIDGGSLAQLMPELRKDAKAVARLMASTARAVHHAHQHGVLHRDLKPANILVDAKCEPHVTDFGLAKRVEGDSNITQSGVIVGTPSYMAPEQATGKKGLTTAADVYSLGAILYELLTGKPPFKGETPLETLMQVMEREPAKPRTLNPRADRELETIAMKCLEKEPTRRYASVEALADDLERWITGRPIQARPTTPVERVVKWAKRQPLLAGAAGVAASAAIGLLILSGILWRNAELRAEAVQNLGQAKAELVVVGGEKEKAEKEKAEATALADEQRNLANEQAALAKRQKELADKVEVEVKRLHGQADTARKELDTARVSAARTLYAADMQLAHAAWQSDNGVGALDLLQRYSKPTGDDPRGFEWHYLWRLTHAAKLEWNIGKSGLGYEMILGLALSPDGKIVATAEHGGKIKLWNLADAKLLRTIDAGKVSLISVAFADEGRKVIAGVRKEFDRKRPDLHIRSVGEAMKKEKFNIKSFGEPLETHTWTVADDKPPVIAPFDPARVPGVLYPVKAGGVFAQHEGDVMMAMSIAGSADGKFLAIAGASINVIPAAQSGVPEGISGGKLILWDVANAKVHSVHNFPIPITAVAFSPDGKRLAIGHSDGIIGVGKVESMSVRTLFQGHRGYVYSLVFSADGKVLVGGASDGHVITWDALGAGKTAHFRGHASAVFRVDMSPDARTIVSGEIGGAIKVWNLEAGTNPQILHGHGTYVTSIAFSASGKSLVSLDRDQRLRTWGSTDGKPFGETKPAITIGLAAHLMLNPAGTKAAWRDTEIKNEVVIRDDALVRDIATGKETRITWKDRSPVALGLSRDGSMLATGSLMAKGGEISQGAVAIWNTSDGKEIASLGDIGGRIVILSFNEAGTQVAVTHTGGVILWDWKTGTSRTIPEIDGMTIASVSFSPDGTKLAILTNPKDSKPTSIVIWEIGASKVLTRLSGAGNEVKQMVFSPNGKRLATVGLTYTMQGMLKLWDVSSGREVFTAATPPGKITAVAFSPDGHHLAAATQAMDMTALLSARKIPGKICIWDATPADISR